jgi:uncharacterized protein YggU (UPF0235/DUF167 family)
MTEREYNFHDGISGAAITVRIVPRSSRNEVSEILPDGMILIRLVTSRGDEKGNGALIAFLADILAIKPGQLEIVAGIKGNDKLISILNLDKQMVHKRILQHLR